MHDEETLCPVQSGLKRARLVKVHGDGGRGVRQPCGLRAPGQGYDADGVRDQAGG